MNIGIGNDPGHQGSIPGGVIPKTQKMALDATRLNTQYYKVRIKGKMEHPPLPIFVVAIKKGDFGSSLTMVANLTFISLK